MNKLFYVLFLALAFTLAACSESLEDKAKSFAEEQVLLQHNGDEDGLRTSMREMNQWMQTLSMEEKLKVSSIVMNIYREQGFNMSGPANNGGGKAQEGNQDELIQCPWCSGTGMKFDEVCDCCGGSGQTIRAQVGNYIQQPNQPSNSESQQSSQGGKGLCSACGGSGHCPICHGYDKTQYGELRYCESCGNTNKCKWCQGSGFQQ